MIFHEIKIINHIIIKFITTTYKTLTHKPKINSVKLIHDIATRRDLARAPGALQPRPAAQSGPKNIRPGPNHGDGLAPQFGTPLCAHELN